MTPGVSKARRLLRLAVRKPLGAFGFCIFLAAVLTAVLAPYLAPHDPLATHVRYRLAAPNAAHYLGNDHLGRDVLSRIIYGARVSMTVGFATVLFGTTLGACIGIVSSYYGGKLDLFVQRCIDAIIPIPTLVLALAIMAVLGRGLINVIIALAIINIPRTARTIRSVGLSVRESVHVEAAGALGSNDARIMLRHIAPNCIAPYIIVSSIALGWAIVVEASLSFLGVGIPPNIPSWGGMLSGATQQHVAVAPWLGIFPGLALSITAFGINLLGDALRDALDPRLRGSEQQP
jgi:peptide/nickel transport system permease protein